MIPESSPVVNNQVTQSALYPAVPPPPVVEAHLSPALSYLESFPQFIVYFLTPSIERPGKLDKLPINLATNAKLEWTTPSNWMTYQAAHAAASSAGSQYGVGFVITPETKLFCLDVDGALMKGVSCPGCFDEETRAMFMAANFTEGLNAPNPECATCSGHGVNKWHPLVDKLRLALPRAGVELSVSYEGLHNWGRYECPEPAHAKVKVVEGVKIELFTSGKWFALGDQAGALGDAGANCTVELQQVIAEYFQPNVAVKKDWAEGHELGWELPADDELIRRAMSFGGGANAAFGDGVSFADLWTRNVSKLSKRYPSDKADFDESGADFALAGKLAWLTGNDCPRIERLMRQSALERDKWDSHKSYLCERTIAGSLVKDGDFYNPNYREEKQQEQIAAMAGLGAAGAPDADSGAMVTIGSIDLKGLEASLLQQKTQDSVALVFELKQAGKLLFNHSRGLWMEWDGTRWKYESTQKAFDFTRNLARALNFGGASSMGSASFCGGVEKFAQASRTFAVEGERFDRDNYLLNTPAGTIDLRTGLTRPHDQADMITKCTTAAPNAGGDGVVFRKFMMEITDGDEELIQFLQVSLGACLSGALEDHWMLFWIGEGRNGKNTLGDLVEELLGDYALKIPASTLMAKAFEGHSAEIAQLQGARIAMSSEINDGDFWHESRIKELSGDANIRARFMRENFFTFRRTHKHLVYGNHRPQLRSVGNAIRSRIKIVPFKVQFTGEREDKSLPGRLRGEMGYVLQWLIDGHSKWLAAGKKLPKCAAVEAESADYFASQSTPEMWLAERCEILTEDVRQSRLLPGSSDLYRDYSEWKKARGEQPISQTRWAQGVMRGFEKVQSTWGFRYKGLRLLPLMMPGFGPHPIPGVGAPPNSEGTGNYVI
jgi:putative DNA primase/helicase